MKKHTIIFLLTLFATGYGSGLVGSYLFAEGWQLPALFGLILGSCTGIGVYVYHDAFCKSP